VLFATLSDLFLEYSQNYFRFDPSSDLGNLDVADFASGVIIDTVTTNYLERHETRKMIEDCAKCIKVNSFPGRADCIHNPGGGLDDTSEVENDTGESKSYVFEHIYIDVIPLVHLDMLEVTEMFQGLVLLFNFSGIFWPADTSTAGV
jgi:hypothetical protein